MNIWIGEGRLVRDPELKVVGGGTEICVFTVAVDRGRKDKDGNKQTDFIDCTSFGKTAAFVNKYFKKGDGILIRGRFQSDKYTAKDGTNRTKWGVWVDEVEFPASKSGTGLNNANKEEPEQPAFTDASDEDAPF